MFAQPAEVLCRVPDEELDREYVVRVTFVAERPDARSPSGDVRLDRLTVVEARFLDESGRLVESKRGPLASEFSGRVWELIEADSLLREEIEDVCRSGRHDRALDETMLARWLRSCEDAPSRTRRSG